MTTTDWKSQARTTLVALLQQAEKVGSRLGNREAVGEELGPDPKSMETLCKLIQVVSDCVTSGDVLDGKNGGSEDAD